MTSHDLVAKIHIASCAHVERRATQPAWRAIADENPDMTLLLGDNIYSEGWSHSVLRKQYLAQRNVPDYKHFRDTCFHMATWDDHDFGPNNALGGTAAAQQNGETGISRRDEARNLFLEFMANKVPDPSALTTVPDEIYCSYMLGTVFIIMLDGRYYREDVADGPDAEFLGPQQEAWLWDQFEIAKSKQVTATLVCCGSTISSSKTKSENLSLYSTFYEKFRTRFIQCPNPIYLAGDIHQNRIRIHDGFLEVISSGVAQRRNRPALSALLTGRRKQDLNNRAVLYIHNSHVRVTMHGSDNGDEAFDFPLKDHLPAQRELNQRNWKNAEG